MHVLVTGSAGLVGSAVTRRFLTEGHHVHGIDNYLREDMFPGTEVRHVASKLAEHKNYSHNRIDVRDSVTLVRMLKPDLVVHCAGQPSHDWSATNVLSDFDLNATATVQLLEATACPFVFMSTNKVYGTNPNKLYMVEGDTRYDCPMSVDESMSVDHTMHSPFGVSKLAADLMVQEYGRYFNRPTVCLRMGCITGKDHAGTELHGFLAYVKKCCDEKRLYRITGNGKQVRDNLHADDVAQFVWLWSQKPMSGVYNIGGGRRNSCSVLEALQMYGGCPTEHVPDRLGDHLAYITNYAKAHQDFGWSPSVPLERLLD